MPTVRVIHWRAAEAVPLIDACRRAGFEVEYLEGDGGAVCRAIRTKTPDAIVIDLSRLPSHGREVAVWLRGGKPTRAIPIVFVGGDELKVAAIRELLPDATYCETSNVAAVLKRRVGKRAAEAPVVPPGMMERSGEKSAAEKLGIAASAVVAVIEPPRDFPALLGDVPEAVEFQEAAGGAAITLWFVHDRESLLSGLRRMRTVAGQTRLWLLWRKGERNDGLTQNAIREMTREVGLVDYRICAVNGRWSAMLFARKKS